MKRLKIILYILTFINLSLFAQETTIKLPTTDNTSSFNVTMSNSLSIFKLNADGGFYMKGYSGAIPTTGNGTRLMWYPSKSAFRVGYVSSTQWDDANIGDYSVAMGNGTTASGHTSVAMGYGTTASGGSQATAMGRETTASGNFSTAMGSSTTASESYSTAMGNGTTASGASSTAMGNGTTASGTSSTAMGLNTTAGGNYSTTMGYNTAASGDYSTAMGYNTTASSDYSTAMGRNTTAYGRGSTAMGNYCKATYEGSFVIGDESTITVMSDGHVNRMKMRFAGGYFLYSDASTSLGVRLLANSNSWSSVSDSTKKENVLLADGEYFLNSIAKLRLGSWNYKEQGAKDFRHYGPMAQEIFRYFGKDEYGTIGCDTLLTTADMDGIMMIALQALEVRSKTLEKANEDLKLTINDLRLTNEKQEVRSEKLEIENSELKERFAKLEKLVNGLIENNNIEVAIK